MSKKNVNVKFGKATGVIVGCFSLLILAISVTSYEYIVNAFNLKKENLHEDLLIVGALIVGAVIGILIVHKAGLIENETYSLKDLKSGLLGKKNDKQEQAQAIAAPVTEDERRENVTSQRILRKPSKKEIIAASSGAIIALICGGISYYFVHLNRTISLIALLVAMIDGIAMMFIFAKSDRLTDKEKQIAHNAVIGVAIACICMLLLIFIFAYIQRIQ